MALLLAQYVKSQPLEGTGHLPRSRRADMEKYNDMVRTLSAAPCLIRRHDIWKRRTGFKLQWSAPLITADRFLNIASIAVATMASVSANA